MISINLSLCFAFFFSSTVSQFCNKSYRRAKKNTHNECTKVVHQNKKRKKKRQEKKKLVKSKTKRKKKKKERKEKVIEKNLSIISTISLFFSHPSFLFFSSRSKTNVFCSFLHPSCSAFRPSFHHCC